MPKINSFQPLVSIIIACYNGERFLAEAIDSVIEQNYEPIEIIVIDDGSSDRSREIVQSYPNVQYYYQENKGVCYSRNKGMNECHGDYLIFLDQDDRLPVGRIIEDILCFQQFPDCAFIFGWTKEIDKNGNFRVSYNIPNLEKADYITMLKGDALIPPGTVTFCTDKLKSVGGFNQILKTSEDFDLYLRLSRKFSIHCHNRITLEYRRHEDNWSNRYGEARSLRNILNRLDEQRDYIKDNIDLYRAYKEGKRHWICLLGPRAVGELIMHIKNKEVYKATAIFLFLIMRCPDILLSTFFSKLMNRLSFN
ncbi:glycosyltransferase [Methylobacter sp. YRD-M1]|uniref:glycosyltransferase n=1 Tax=Methylobacter sp. YRD-M1 TaxID=2911520 RepID=UPI00227D4FBD|nr:glycosyltransferase [Methylobacter sp. YRD-M1]WAK01143.1 glycosyltransferase [Methylobacter sp. YRD-M1]